MPINLSFTLALSLYCVFLCKQFSFHIQGRLSFSVLPKCNQPSSPPMRITLFLPPRAPFPLPPLACVDNVTTNRETMSTNKHLLA